MHRQALESNFLGDQSLRMTFNDKFCRNDIQFLGRDLQCNESQEMQECNQKLVETRGQTPVANGINALQNCTHGSERVLNDQKDRSFKFSHFSVQCL